MRLVFVLPLVLLAVPAFAQDGAALYAQHCSLCHDGGVVRAPARRALSEITPERIVASLESFDPANCPASNGPDFDFASPPMLVMLPSGERRLVVGQKSGVVHGLDTNSGTVLWSTRIGKGGMLGGVEWGSATDGRQAYVALSDQTFKRSGGPVVIGMTALDPTVGGGLFALRLTDGAKVWETPPPGCGDRPMCSPAQSAAISAMPGVVFSGSVDGHLRAYAAGDGRILWDFDTARDFDTVNKVAARGGSIDVGGPAIAEGVVLTTSGYPIYGGRSGNVLLAFTVDGR
jgi:polyvinyl alcohol dehydrogenase (cytochrome)